MDFSIRLATERDYTGLEILFAEIDTYHREALPKVFRKPDGPARTRDFFSGVLANRNAVIFIAEHQDQIIGMVHAYIRALPEIPIRIPCRAGEIDSLIVTQKYRRYGVGKALMERAHQWAEEMKLDRLELSVWDFNQGARDFYRELDYEPAFLRMWKNGPFPKPPGIDTDKGKPLLFTSTEYHNAHAKEYDAGYDTPYWRIYNEITWNYIRPCLPKNKKKSLILDAGGGTGLWAIRIARLGFKVILADVSSGMLDEARRKIEMEDLQKQIEIVEADITNLKAFKTGTFDLTLAEGDPVSYCSNPKSAISELARVTKRDGFVTVSVDNKHRWAFRWLKMHDFQKSDKALRKGIGNMQGIDHSFPAHMFTIEELQALFRKNRLNPVKSVGKPVWTTGDDYLNDNEIFERVLKFELRYSLLPSVAGAGGHIAVIGRKK